MTGGSGGEDGEPYEGGVQKGPVDENPRWCGDVQSERVVGRTSEEEERGGEKGHLRNLG